MLPYESNDTVVVENNHYFPASIKKEYFKPMTQKLVPVERCVASYYSIQADGTLTTSAAWYPDKICRQNIYMYGKASK
jgi:uncharacterized protein (DUF427 family)